MISFDEATHTYQDEKGIVLPGVTNILKAAGLIDASWFTEESRLLGQYVHEATALFDNGELDEETLDPAIHPYLEAWKAFVESADMLVFAQVERPVVHPILRYAGTPDRLMVREEDNVLVDVKSGQPQPWHGVQLAAYEHCFEAPMQRWGVYLSADGKFKRVGYTDRHDWQVFQSALTLFTWRGNHGYRDCSIGTSSPEPA